MRNAILTLSIAFVLLNSGAASAQILTQSGRDTAVGYYTGDTSLQIDNRIKSGSSNPVYLKWKIVATNLDQVPGWNSLNSGVCDNVICQTAGSSFNPFTNGQTFKSSGYDNSGFSGTVHDFHVILNNHNPAVGSSAYVRVQMQDTVSFTTRTLTFIGMRSSTGITSINSSDDVVLYPNPARDAVNVVYDDKAGVKTIAVYNLIGKLMGPIYKPSNNGSAKIDLDDMPNGIYFLRLMDGQGHVVATRRFTRQ